MSDAARLRAQAMAAEYLRQLLLKPGPYRDAWQQHVVRPRGDDVINQLAVAEVMAGHLATAGRGDQGVMLHQVRDTVSRALSGGQVSQQALELLVEAFGFSDLDAGRLWRLWTGSTTISVMSGTHAVPISAQYDVYTAIGPRRHQSLSLHDHITMAADGRIDRGRTLQVIEATAQGVDRIPFLCDTNVLTLEVGQGCKEVAGEIRQVGKDVFATEILLSRTLDVGETLSLEYWLSYKFPGDFTDPLECQYRRGIITHIDHLDMRVEFHPDRLPAQLWWAQWDGGDGDVLAREAVTLDSQHSAHRYLRSIERTVAGFYWAWGDQGPVS